MYSKTPFLDAMAKPILYFRVMIASVEEKGNNTKKYYEAGVHIVPSFPLARIDTDSCDVACMMEKITMETEVGHWRGWQVCISVPLSIHCASESFNMEY